MTAVCIAVLLAAADVGPLELPPRLSGPITARAGLRVAQSGAGPALARVWLTLAVDGPPGLEVEGPRLEDALAGWRVPQSSSAWSTDGRWGATLLLEQVKPGPLPLPGVVLRVRPGPQAAWAEVSWPDLLHKERPVADPEYQAPPPPSPWPRRLAWVGVGLAVLAGLAALAALGRRWRAPVAVALTPTERALAALQVPGDDPAGRLAAVLRGYLAERFGVEASARTTAELQPDLDATTAELLGWCDEVKFAGRSAAAPECAAAYERARRYFRDTAARPEQTGRSGEGEPSEQSR